MSALTYHALYDTSARTEAWAWRVRIYKNAWFAKFARKERIGDAAWCEAVDRAGRGLIDADLGGGVIKKRVAREGAGKSGGYRTLILFRRAERAIFALGFAKNDRENVSTVELAALKDAAETMLGLTPNEIEAVLRTGKLLEVKHGDEDVQERNYGIGPPDDGGLL